MRIVNLTPFQFAPLSGKIAFPGDTLTLVVKGTFDLSPGRAIEPSEKQIHVSGDVHHPDDVEGTGSLRYESDFAPYKPRADLLLVGCCHPPRGEPVRSCPVVFQVGDRARRFLVWGDRFWKGPPGLRTMTDPEPFSRMDLRWENAFGGPGFGANPVGKGFRSEEGEGGERAWALPNVEDPDELVESPRHRPRPAGAGPMARGWSPRAGKVGSYRGSWARERWPWYPEDFDYGYFNAAPPELQAGGYLRGDEEIYLENLHPRHARYQARLPGLRVRAFLHAPPSGGQELQLREVALGLDTLWVDAEEEKVVLVWRGWTEVESEEYDEVQHVLLLSESLEEAPASLAACRERLLATLAATDAPPEASPEPAEPLDPPEGEPGAAPQGPEEAAKRAAELRKQVDARVDALLAQAGIRMEALSPEARESLRKERSRFRDAFTEADPERALARQRADLKKQLSASLAKAGIDLERLPPVSSAASREQARFLRELGVKEPEKLLGGPEMARFFALFSAILPGTGVDPEDLSPLIELARTKGIRIESPPEDGEEGSAGAGHAPEHGWTRETVAEAAGRGGSLAGEDLSGLDLSGLDLSGVDLGGADLTGATLRGTALSAAILAEAKVAEVDLSGADLTGANLAGAELRDAVLTKARLDGADLTRARLPRATLSGATMANALFMEAEMPEARLDGVAAKGAYFIGADLKGALLIQSDFPGADFSRGTLDGADFGSSDLTEASLESVSCKGTNFSLADLSRLRASEGSDFSGCSFVRVLAPESIWGSADLSGADLSYAQMQGASFMGARLAGALLYAADMKEARFTRADLTGARMMQMNLFRGNLERANLTEADLGGSNLYGAELHGVVLSETNLEGANLRMTTLKEG